MSLDLSFLEDESLTDNLEDTLAKRALFWLEKIAESRPDDLQKVLSFIRLYNQKRNDDSKEEYLRVLFEFFEVLTENAEFKESTLAAVVLTAETVLNLGDNDEPQKRD